MKNRVINLLNSLINQYEQLIYVKFDGDAPDIVNKTAELKLKHHLAQLEESIRQLINAVYPIFIYYGNKKYSIDEYIVDISNDVEIEGIDHKADQRTFLNFTKELIAGKFFEYTLDVGIQKSYVSEVNSYCKLVEVLEIRNKDFKYRTTTLLMCCSDC